MRNSQTYKYSDISSFKDFRNEKERLRLKSKIAETRLTISYLEIKKIFSVSNLFFSVAREIILPKAVDLLGNLKRNIRKPAPDEGDESQD